MSDPFEIVIGTYEQYLLGYKVSSIVNEYKMEKVFATHSHLSSIRSVASSKHYVASAGADDSVYLYDFRRRMETGRLMHHNDTVTCITFTPDASHLFTCSYDGSIAAVRCGSWQIEKHWPKAHKGLPVNALAIHPTGKIALSTGEDGILRTWNLVKGRQAYATNLFPRSKMDAKNVTVLKWSPSGTKYLLAVNRRIDVYSVQLAGIDSEIEFDAKVVCVEFLRDDLIAVGLENGRIRLHDLEKAARTVDTVAHDIRVKCMAFKDDLLVSASSSGEIKLWRYGRRELRVLRTVNCGARITCLSLINSYENAPASVPEKREDESEDEEEARTERGRKFRPTREVIVEQEGDWHATSLSDSPRPASNTIDDKKKKKKKKGQKRGRGEARFPYDPDSRKSSVNALEDEAVEGDSVVDSVPKKRSKWSNDDHESKSSSERVANKKRKGGANPVEENGSAASKRMKKLNEKVSKAKSIGNGKGVAKKRKKDSAEEEAGAVLTTKKKKKKKEKA